MSSLIKRYNYDVFISYRQKDNKHDGWVTEFVDNLKGELESTFKEEISVYFDINPHDGLLEIHDVDESLKEKLKCLIFIPIISRTYCDPKAFAWEHEFKAFVEQASKDEFGLKVRLPNGNVASRVLPVQIHDLDTEDNKAIESVLGAFMRSIEFIYREPGVDRPLTVKDSEEKNLNKTNYRNQINKVALAIKEIIQGLKSESATPVIEKSVIGGRSERGSVKNKKIGEPKPFKLNKHNWLLGTVIAVILIIAGVFAYQKIFKKKGLEYLQAKSKISLAVMPFTNTTGDATLDGWQSMIQYNIITSLTGTEELSVINQESVDYILQSQDITNYASFTPSLAGSISKRLNSDVYIYGNIGQIGNVIRINAQLADTKIKEIFKSFQIEVSSREDLNFQLIDVLSVDIENFLVLNQLKQVKIPDQQLSLVSTDSPEAYTYYKYGKDVFAIKDWNLACDYFSKAIEIDSNFAFAAILLSFSYSNRGMYDESKKCIEKFYERKDQISSPQIKVKLEDRWADITEGPQGRIKWLKQLPLYDDQDPHNYSDLGFVYNKLGLYDEAIPEFIKALDIYKNWGTKPFWVNQYTDLGLAYHETGQYRKERNIYKKAEKDFPDAPNLLRRQAILALSQSKKKTSEKYIEKFVAVSKEQGTNESSVATNLANIYWEAELPDEAEEYFRQALSFDGENPNRINNLAWFLIDKERNINEGLELVEKALQIAPDSPDYLACKGWGLYKTGRYDEALKVLEKALDLEIRPNQTNTILSHIQEVNQAIPGR